MRLRALPLLAAGFLQLLSTSAQAQSTPPRPPIQLQLSGSEVSVFSLTALPRNDSRQRGNGLAKVEGTDKGNGDRDDKGNANGKSESARDSGSDLVRCLAPCSLAVRPGRYLLLASLKPAPDPANDDRRIVKRDLLLVGDARLRVQPGSRWKHSWGLGTTIAGSTLLGLGAILFVGRHAAGAGSNPTADAVTYSLLGAGAASTATGLYLLIDGRNRIQLERGPNWPKEATRSVELGFSGRF